MRRVAPAIRLLPLLVLALLVHVPTQAAPTTGEQVAVPAKAPDHGETKAETPTQAEAPANADTRAKVNCADTMVDAKGKPTDKFDPRCTEAMIKAAKAAKAAAAQAGYDIEKLKGLEGLGQSSETGAPDADDVGTFEDLFGPGGRFDVRRAFPDAGRPAEAKPAEAEAQEPPAHGGGTSRG